MKKNKKTKEYVTPKSAENPEPEGPNLPPKKDKV